MNLPYPVFVELIGAVLMILTSIAGAKNLTDIKTKYIEGITPQDSLLMAFSLFVPDAHSYHSAVTEKLCTCWTMCKAHPVCTGVSAEPNAEGDITCRLTKMDITQVDLTRKTNATFMFKKDASAYYFAMQLDRFFYQIPGGEQKDQHEAESYCMTIPGHRLAVNDQIPLLEDIISTSDLGNHREYLLKDILTGGHKFIKEGAIRSISDDGSVRYFICQANPNNLPW